MSSTFKTHLEHFDISLQPSNSQVISIRCYPNAHLFSSVIGRTRNGFLFHECLSRRLPHHIILICSPEQVWTRYMCKGKFRLIDHFHTLLTISNASAYSTPTVIPRNLAKYSIPSYERGCGKGLISTS